MKRRVTLIIVLGLLAVLPKVFAQENTYQSVLSEHTWYRLSVTKEGVYQLDFSTLQAMGVDFTDLNPNQIRLFGNPSGALPEKNSATRPDDLTEMAIYVEGAEDGVFNESDKVLFYGQEPTRWSVAQTNNKTYVRNRNPYSDTTYYYLCVDSGINGLRVGEKASLPLDAATAVITEFPDFFWHEEELMSPFSLGQNWFGERISGEDSLLSIPFVFPNLVTEKSLLMRSQVLGRVADGTMKYNIFVENNHLASNVSISEFSDNYYGRLSSLEKQFTLDSDSASFDLSIIPNGDASLYLDYVEIYAWRRLIREGYSFPFRLLPSQFGQGVSAIWVQNTSNEFWLWEVTDPLKPIRQEGVLSSDNFVFAVNEAVERRYFMFNPLVPEPVAHWKAIPKQNLHSIVDADMLIITLPMFMEQAQALAEFHAEMDGMQSVVVDVNEIYNEFSTGIPDPTGIRDFVRMVYRRSAGNLKYLTLFGRASFDFRNLKGLGRDFIPCYETSTQPHWDRSFCTDDYFGLMDDNEGADSKGYVDLGIGRIPVSTVAEANAVLEKIRHYNDLANVHGDWKSDILFFSDNENLDYITHNETYVNMLDTIYPPLTAKKVYCGAYPVVQTSSGNRIPGANAEVTRTLEKGVLAMIYTGHGGVTGLTSERVFTNSEIAALGNYDKMPFVFTATCEFTKYDNPLLVSAGEQMFLAPHGGSVAMLTTSRPTVGTNNYKIGKALMQVLFSRDRDGKALRFGDIVRLAKSNTINFPHPLESSNICYLFLGDPALRFALPQEEIVVKRINGVNPNQIEVGLHAMSMVNLEGEVRMGSGQTDTQFNGKLWVKFFDKKSKVVVALNNGSRNVYYHKDVLYQGEVSVEAGKFTLSFQVPKDIMMENDQPRFSFYAYDSIRNIDAMGKFDELVLGGTDPAAVADDEGPRIDFYWNAPDFEDGAHVERQGVLYADLYDAQGIYHYDYSLGRDIVMNSNCAQFDRLVLNDHYEPALNDFRRGRIAIPVSDLTPGTYEFNLKVWDTQDNPSEAQLWFVVDDDLFLSQVRNYPNPFCEETYITLKHLGEDASFNVNVEIFDVMGRFVFSFSKRVSAVNGVIEPIRWDGCDQSGHPLQTGMYLYRLTMTDEAGTSRTVTQKMVIQR